MSYQLIENTPDGFVTHQVDDAEMALSLWYGLDGEVQHIKNELNQDIKLEDLIAEVAAKKSSQRNLPPAWESAAHN